MTFPAVEARASGRDTGSVTVHPITLPSGIVAGELLLVLFSNDATGIPTSNEGWTRLAYRGYGAPARVTGAVFYKIAEGGDTLSITTSNSQEASHISFRISGARTPTCTGGIGSGTNSNPPQHIHPPGSEDILWIATRSGDSTVVATDAPDGFGNLQTLAAATSGGASSNTAEKLLKAAVLDPEVFTSAAEQWVTFTIAVPPATPPIVIEGGVEVIVRCRCSHPDEPDPISSYLASILLRVHQGTLYRADGGDHLTYYYMLSTPWLDFRYTWEVNPYTGEAWTVAEVEALQAGVWLWASAWTPVPYTSSWCTQVWIFVSGLNTTKRPTATGAYNSGGPVGDTPGWKCVDEIVSDGETTYVRYTTSGTSIPGSGGYSTYVLGTSTTNPEVTTKPATDVMGVKYDR